MSPPMPRTDIAAMLGGRSARADLAGTLTLPEPGVWALAGTHLLFRWCAATPDRGPVRVAAFDLDGTLVHTRLHNVKFARGPSDWRWFNDHVSPTLARLAAQDYLLVIFTNQGGVVPGPSSKLYQNFTARVDQVCAQSPAPMAVFALPKRPAGKRGPAPSPESLHVKMRKPQAGMWEALAQILRDKGCSIDMASSFFVGDAAGRAGDFLDSDKQFAHSVGIKFLVPEDIFKEDGQVEEGQGQSTVEEHAGEDLSKDVKSKGTDVAH